MLGTFAPASSHPKSRLRKAGSFGWSLWSGPNICISLAPSVLRMLGSREHEKPDDSGALPGKHLHQRELRMSKPLTSDVKSGALDTLRPKAVAPFLITLAFAFEHPASARWGRIAGSAWLHSHKTMPALIATAAGGHRQPPAEYEIQNGAIASRRLDESLFKISRQVQADRPNRHSSFLYSRLMRHASPASCSYREA